MFYFDGLLSNLLVVFCIIAACRIPMYCSGVWCSPNQPTAKSEQIARGLQDRRAETWRAGQLDRGIPVQGYNAIWGSTDQGFHYDLVEKESEVPLTNIFAYMRRNRGTGILSCNYRSA